MRNFRKILFAVLIFGIISVIFSCKKDDPIIPNEEELITTVRLKLINISNAKQVEFSFRDIDGEGGEAPVITAGILEKNSIYLGEISLLNEQTNPADNITAEVEEEGVDHQFFFETDVLGVSFYYQDTDIDGKPIGILFQLATQDAGQGTMTLILRHQADKNADGVSNGDITNAGGETDLEISFDLNVQ